MPAKVDLNKVRRNAALIALGAKSPAGEDQVVAGQVAGKVNSKAAFNKVGSALAEMHESITKLLVAFAKHGKDEVLIFPESILPFDQERDENGELVETNRKISSVLTREQVLAFQEQYVQDLKNLQNHFEFAHRSEAQKQEARDNLTGTYSVVWVGPILQELLRAQSLLPEIKLGDLKALNDHQVISRVRLDTLLHLAAKHDGVQDQVNKAWMKPNARWAALLNQDALATEDGVSTFDALEAKFNEKGGMVERNYNGVKETLPSFTRELFNQNYLKTIVKLNTLSVSDLEAAADSNPTAADALAYINSAAGKAQLRKDETAIYKISEAGKK